MDKHKFPQSSGGDLATMSESQFIDSLDALIEVNFEHDHTMPIFTGTDTAEGFNGFGSIESNESLMFQGQAATRMTTVSEVSSAAAPAMTTSSPMSEIPQFIFNVNSNNCEDVDRYSHQHQHHHHHHHHHHESVGRTEVKPMAKTGGSRSRKPVKAKQTCSQTTKHTKMNHRTKRKRLTKESQEINPYEQEQQRVRSTGTMPAISEDEVVDAMKWRCNRNAREQARSHRISEQIATLHQLLHKASIQHKTDKYHTLLSTVQYVRKLQHDSTDLQDQLDSLLKTLKETSDVVNQAYVVGVSSYQSPKVVSCSNTNTASGLVDTMMTENPDGLVKSSDGAVLSPFDTCTDRINYKWIFDACTFASAVTSIDGRFLECNKYFTHLTGYSKSDLLQVTEGKTRNMSLFNILSRSHIERVFAPLSEMLQYNEETRKQKSHKDAVVEIVDLGRKNIPYKTVQLCVTLIRSSAGLPQYFNCVLTPVDDIGFTNNIIA